MLEMVAMYLTSRGLEVHTCLLSDGAPKEGLSTLIEQWSPDVIIYDIDLPYEDRWREAMAIALLPEVSCPFIFTSTNQRVAEQLLKNTASATLLAKPYELETLYDAVHHALGLTPPPRHEKRSSQRRRNDRRK